MNIIDQEQARIKAAQRGQLRAAAVRVRQLYPGPVGDLVAEEIFAWESMGFRFGGAGPMMRLVDFIMKQPVE